MDVELIQMDPAAARERLHMYRDALKRRADAEYEAAAMGYEALAKGTPLVDIAEVFQACPVDAKGRPRLAIARADRKQVEFRAEGHWWGSSPTVTEYRFDAASPNGNYLIEVRVPVDIEVGSERPKTGFALVPMVPPDVEPRKAILRKRSILWEVEAWSDRRIGATPDRDPYLLEHVTGTLYAVVGAWDLTPLEQAVMTGRREA